MATGKKIVLRKAKIKDAKGICDLINRWANKKKMLQRSVNSVYDNIRDFWVYTENKKIVGCCALEVVGWDDLAEIRSLAVSKRAQGKGIGAELVKQCMEEAEDLGVKNIFALTYVDGFFKKLGFKEIQKDELPHKIWTDCLNCPSFFKCKEKAVLIKL